MPGRRIANTVGGNVPALALTLIITFAPAFGREHGRETGGCARFVDAGRLQAAAHETVGHLQELREEVERSAARLGTSAFEEYIDALREQEEIVWDSLHRFDAVSCQPSAACLATVIANRKSVSCRGTK